MMQHNLFISSFKSKRNRSSILVLLFVVFFLLGNKILNYLYWMEDDWCRVFWHNYYAQTENIDHIFLGSSHVYCGLNPEILDEKTQKNNFNMATPAQRLIESYYLLKEADRHNTIKKAYLELYYNPSTGNLGDYQNHISVLNGWKCMDHMKNSFYKLETLISINPSQYYLEAFFPYIRYREYIMDGDWIKECVEYKTSENYKEYIFNDGLGTFRDKGYYYTNLEVQELSFIRDRKPEEMHLTEEAEKYLRKIILYCQERNISLTFFTVPVHDIQLIATENYDSYASQIKEIATEYDVPYYDFNMVREEYLPIQDRQYFMNVGHLNAKGAELYTNFFYEIVSKSPEDNRKYFYDSYQEKLEYSEAKVYGIYRFNDNILEIQEGDMVKKIKKMIIASNREDELEYQVFWTPYSSKETTLLRDFSKNKEFDLPAEEYGNCTIVWRDISTKQKVGRIDLRN